MTNDFDRRTLRWSLLLADTVAAEVQAPCASDLALTKALTQAITASAKLLINSRAGWRMKKIAQAMSPGFWMSFPEPALHAGWLLAVG